MTTYNIGEVYKDVPVLKFIGHGGIVVFLKGKPEYAEIKEHSNLRGDIDLGDTTAPQGTKADVIVVSASYAYSNSLEATNIRI